MSTHQAQATLQLYLLGTPQVVLAGESLTDLPVKTQALLFYLAVTRQPHSRAPLATLLWGDSAEKNARASLRKALQQLRQALPDHLILTEQSVALRTDESIWVDATHFVDQITQSEQRGDTDLPAEVIPLYRGDFLNEFSVPKAPDFERWQAFQQIRLREQMIGALQSLSHHWIAQDDIANAIATTRRMIELEPWREEAHRQLMALLAHNGERGAALAHFDECQKQLQRELDVEPGPETVALYEQIRAGTVGPVMNARETPIHSEPQPSPATSPAYSVEQSDLPLPAFLTAEPSDTPQRTTPFVARTTALAQLDRQFTQALAGAGQIVFLIGQPGSGKSALSREFIHRALAREEALIVAQGNCHAFHNLLPLYEGRGLVYMLLTEYLNAIADFQEMLRLARSTGDQLKEGEALCHLAFANWSMFAAEHAPFAEQYGQEAYALAQAIGDERILAKSMTSIGFMHQWRGNLPDAANRLEASLAISRRNGYHASIGQNLLWLSVQANWQGDFQTSVRLGNESLAVARELHDGLQELFSLAFLGLAAGGAGDYSTTFALFEEGLAKAKERENPFFIGRFTNQLGWYYSEFGDVKRALELDLESLEFGRISGVSNVEISALINIGLDYLAQGQYAEAQSYLEPTLERVRLGDFGAHQWRWLMRLLIGLAELALATGDHERALAYVDEGLKGALKTGSQKYIAKGQAIRGKILLALKQPAGGQLLQQASQLATQIGSPSLIYPLCYELGQWQASQGQATAALANYRQAQSAIESMMQAIDDAELQATFRQSGTVRAVRGALLKVGE